MIEMSVDKETVPTRSMKVDPVPPQKFSECTGSCNNAPKVPEVTLANPDSTDGAATCPMPDSGAQTKHSSTADPHDQTKRVEQEAMLTEQHVKPKNGFQQPKQQPQQQKLSKRRSTMIAGFKHPAGKRRRRVNSESDSVLPTNFLLGGNIFDPLNLNSLQDEEVNRALNAETPKSSPLPAKNRDPVEILIPRDITDPLNLNSRMGGRSLLVSPFKSGGRRRHRNRHHGGGGGGSTVSVLDLSDSERIGEVTNTTSSLSNLASASAASTCVLEAPSVPAVLDPQDANGNEINPSNCRHEAMLTVSAPQAQPRAQEDSSAATAGGPNHLSSRQRKRRRNSGKTEPPMVQSTLMARSGTEERGRGAGPGRNAQSSFHTPVVGPRGSSQVPGGRQPHLHNQHKQPHQGNKKKFQYGNYNKYYGYRNPGCAEDPRFRCLRPEWFHGKAVLDLGCNTGHLTLCIAKKLRPARILGLDIDGGLVHAARQNIRHYLSELQAQEARRAAGDEKEKTNGPGEERKEKANRREDESHSGGLTHKQNERQPSRAVNGNAEKQVPAEAAGGVVLSRHAERRAQERGAEEMEEDSGAPAVELGTSSFPVSLWISRGPIAAPPLPDTPTMPPGNFPSNVSFVKGNYVLESDALLLTQRPEYDVILCFSVTKWVHLNWGDGGLKRLFHRVFRHLRPGGLFVLEPQPWITYGKRKKLTDSIFKNYHSIRLKPEQFSTYLTSEVGFSSYELIGTPNSSSRGFQRPIYLFHKGT
ncbi:7SK snRNA methylphosphate capping enzyme [Oncorhynchus kisutch]|uniref:RNA methyltransferase n=1 Tax=Oncorhynchus kisutch TaxID=8019 RepID=A0A8C7LF37_ONCKI|nr:7SK snRNA methylphosphate capping enzyme [Oncorhynchus kisutch]